MPRGCGRVSSALQPSLEVPLHPDKGQDASRQRTPHDTWATACATLEPPSGNRFRSPLDAGRHSSTGTRTSRVSTGMSTPPAVRGGKASHPFRRGVGHPSVPPRSCRRRSRPPAAAKPGRPSSPATRRATHPAPSTTSSSRNMAHGARPRRFPSLRARLIVAQRLGSSGRRGPVTRCTRTCTPSWASTDCRTSSRGGEKSRLRKIRSTSAGKARLPGPGDQDIMTEVIPLDTVYRRNSVPPPGVRCDQRQWIRPLPPLTRRIPCATAPAPSREGIRLPDVQAT